MSFDLDAAKRCYEKNRLAFGAPDTEQDFKTEFLGVVRYTADTIRSCFGDQFVPFVPSASARREAAIAAMYALSESDYYIDLGLERRGEMVHTAPDIVPAQREALHTVYDAMFQIDPAIAHTEVARTNALGIVALIVVGAGAIALRGSTIGLIACAGMGAADLVGLIILNGIISSHRNAVDRLIEEAVGVFSVDAGYYEEGQPDAETNDDPGRP